MTSFLAVVPVQPDSKQVDDRVDELIIAEVLPSTTPWDAPVDIQESEFFQWAERRRSGGETVYLVLANGTIVEVNESGAVTVRLRSLKDCLRALRSLEPQK